jgi:UDP-N-acetylmuramoyl-L-alanyl-D-glutamate--2,6-diaminopimelate ligase
MAMLLPQLLEGLRVSKIYHAQYGQTVVMQNLQINRLQYDSRKVGQGDLFVAIRGASADGHTFIGSAIERGACAVVMDDDAALPDSYFLHAGVAKIVVPDARIALAQLSARYFGAPADHLTMIGVTGTNGKTTTAHLVRSILESTGTRTGLMGTIEYRTGGEVIPATHTTPESLELNELLARMVREGCTSAVMEVSSHALEQHRVHGISFRTAVFTNLTQDHLDYHRSMEKYFDAKNMLFQNLATESWAVVNADDAWGMKIVRSTPARVITYAIDTPADVHARQVSLSMRGIRFVAVHGRPEEETLIESPLTGKFNVSNILAAFSTAVSLGIPKSSIREAISSTNAVPGRFEQRSSPAGWTAVIDYAHTPDALEKALLAIQEVLTPGGKARIITVFGCGGNRDRAKRPIMGNIASRYSGFTLVTSDNPRHEDPDAIIDEVMAGVEPGAAVERQADRGKAIRRALSLAQPGEVVLIAGKGHEEYQVVGDSKVRFSDREVVEEFIRAHA